MLSLLRNLCLQTMRIWAVACCLVIYAHLLWPILGTWLIDHAERALAVAVGGQADLATLRGVLAEVIPALVPVGLAAHASKVTANTIMAPIFSYFAATQT